MRSAIHIWGDSIARGVFYNEQRERYAISSVRYTAALEDALGVPVQNHAVMGMTSVDGLAAFLKSTPADGSLADSSLCAIEFGGNDCDLDWAYVAAHPQDDIAAKIPLPQYRKALRGFVAAAKSRGMKPLLVTPPPLHGPRYFRWVTRNLDQAAVLDALRGDMHSIYRWQERYALAMRDVAMETSCAILDMRDAFLAQQNYEALMCIDGIHPNEEGHRLIAQTVVDAAKRA